MNRAVVIICGLLAMAAISHVTMRFAHGQVRMSPGNAQAGSAGNAQAGAKIAADGTAAGAPACVSCHGVEGNPDGSGSFPRLFGLPHDYLVKQLEDYAANKRSNDIMTTVAKTLTANEAADVSAYYATATSEPLPKFATGDKGLIMLGEKLATFGDQTKQVPACNACHGPAGIGQPPTIPALAGQFAPYMIQQLSDWQKGARKNDGGQQMASIVKRLTPQDFAAVASYYQQAPSSTTAPTQTPKN